MDSIAVAQLWDILKGYGPSDPQNKLTRYSWGASETLTPTPQRFAVGIQETSVGM